MTNKLEFELLEIDGNQVISKLRELRKDFAISGKYPFILGSAEQLQWIEDNAGFQTLSSEEIIKRSESIDPNIWFDKQKVEFGNDDEALGFNFDWTTPSDSARDLGLNFGDRLLSHQDILKRIPFSKVLFGLAETTDLWKLPALVKFGGWNECPMPEIHCALFRYWQEKFGAEIVAMTNDVIECRVAKPPISEDDVRRLAREQYLYCPDIVDQGTGSVSALAQTLYDSDYWYFWWD